MYIYLFMLLHVFFFFNDPATTEIYTLSLHDALPISPNGVIEPFIQLLGDKGIFSVDKSLRILTDKTRIAFLPLKKFLDRKSTRLNSSHLGISYAVFCLKKKKKK